MRKSARIAITVAAVLLTSGILLQLGLNHIVIPRVVDSLVSRSLEAEVGWSRIHADVWWRFPRIRLEVDSLRICYPAERFSEYDPAKAEARGGKVVAASLDGLSANVGLLRALRGDIRINNAKIRGLCINGVAYNDSVANWNLGRDSAWFNVPLSKLGAKGPLRLPLRADAEFSLEIPKSGGCRLDVQSLDLDAFHLPLKAEGEVAFFTDSIPMNCRLALKECPLQEFVDEYAPVFKPELASIKTDATLSLDVDAKGLYAPASMPELNVSMLLPQSDIYYGAKDVGAGLALDMSAAMTPESVADLELRNFTASAPGLDAGASGSVHDLFGSNPDIKFKGKVETGLHKLLSALDLDDKFKAAGRVNAEIDLRSGLMDLLRLDFENADIHAALSSAGIAFKIDTLGGRLSNPSLKIETDSGGLWAELLIDSLTYRQGPALVAKLRAMQNRAHLFKVEKRGQMTPRLEFSTSGRRLTLRSDADRIVLRDLGADLAVQKSLSRGAGRVMDSTRMHRRDSLRAARLAYEASIDKRLLQSDLVFEIDSTISNIFRDWNPTGSIKISRGAMISPQLPLRTRISAIRGSFDGNELKLDTLGMRCGRTDYSGHGYLKGIRRAIRGKGFIRTELKLHSRNTDVNELVAAVQMGKKMKKDTTLADEDESFVKDSLPGAKIDFDKLRARVLPGNVDASFKLLVDTLRFTDVLVTPMTAELKMKDRIMQLSDADLKTNIGHINATMYYATRSIDELKNGINLDLDSMKVQNVIALMPSVSNKIPALKSFTGLVNLHLSATTQIDTCMNVNIPTLEALLRISGRDMNVADAGDLKKITGMLMFKNPNIGHIDDLDLDAVVHNSRIEIFPFQLGVDRYKLALQGMQNFDKSMYYHVSVLKWPLLIPFGLDISGTLDKWNVGLSSAKYLDGKVPAFTTELDNMQVNIFDTVQNIFNRGVESIERYNKNYASIQYDRGESKALDGNTYSKLEAARMNSESDEEEAVAREVEEALEESYRDIEEMLKSFKSKIYTKGELRKIENIFGKGK